MKNREILTDESLECVSGGSLGYVWDSATQTGYVRSNSYNPDKKYYFNADNYANVVSAVKYSGVNLKSDQEDLADMMQWFFKVE